MKGMIQRLNVKVEHFEEILKEMREEQSKMFSMLTNHIMLQQSHGGGSSMKTDSFEDNGATEDGAMGGPNGNNYYKY